MNILVVSILLVVTFLLLWVYRRIEEVAVTDPFITDDSEKELWRVNLIVAIFGSMATTGAIWVIADMIIDVYIK